MFNKKRKIEIVALFLILNCYFVHGQALTFDSYNNVTNAVFSDYLDAFDQRELPISTDDILHDMDIRNLRRSPIDKSFLTDNGELITGALYNEKTDEGDPNPIMGKFYPICKLPTNGDYVMVVIAQIDEDIIGYDKVFIMTYDLEGNFLYLVNYLYSAGTADINNFLDENLQSHYVYVANEVNGEMVFPTLEETFSSEEAHLIYQINSDGKGTRVSFETITGTFIWVAEEFRFKKIN